jgi:putative phosphoserine phosphatase/1-acylglycerol-3-phosphate O-acyltransferase
MEAKVPIVPVVFRNVLDALPKGALIVRPAVIEAVVLPAIDTSAWTLDTLDEEIERIHDRYLAILSGAEA